MPTIDVEEEKQIPLDEPILSEALPTDMQASSKGFNKVVPIIAISITVLLLVGTAAFAFVTRQRIIISQNQEASVKKKSPLEDLLVSPLPSFSPIATIIPSTLPMASSSPVQKRTAIPTPSAVATTLDLTLSNVSLYLVGNALAYLNPSTGNTVDIEERVWTSTSSPITVSFTIQNNLSSTVENVSYKVLVNGSEYKSAIVTVSSLPGQQNAGFSVSLPKEVGNYTVKIELNSAKQIRETEYGNNAFEFPYSIRPDTQAPIASFETIKRGETQETCLTPRSASDNVTNENELEFEGSLDNENWYSFKYRPDPSLEYRYERCLTGPSAEQHTFRYKVKDKRGNQSEGTYTFYLYAF